MPNVQEKPFVKYFQYEQCVIYKGYAYPFRKFEDAQQLADVIERMSEESLKRYQRWIYNGGDKL